MRKGRKYQFGHIVVTMRPLHEQNFRSEFQHLIFHAQLKSQVTREEKPKRTNHSSGIPKDSHERANERERVRLLPKPHPQVSSCVSFVYSILASVRPI